VNTYKLPEVISSELLEEPGYHSDNVTFLGKTFPLPGLYNHTTNIALAANIKKNQEALA